MPADSENRPSRIRDVGYAPAREHVEPVEVTRIADLLDGAREAEFEGPQRLTFDLLVQVDAGSTEHRVDLTTYALRPGDVLWVRAGQVQQWGEIEALEGTILMAAPAAFAPATHRLLDRLGASSRTHWPGVAAPGSEFAATFEHLLRAPAVDRIQDPAARAAVASHLAAASLIALAASAPGGPAPARPSLRIDDLRAEIDTHFADDRSVAGYARRLGCSPRTLHRTAYAATGRSPKQLIDDRIMLEARRLLAHEDTTVTAIAQAVGFHDTANFVAFFRKREGRTPAEFRRAG